MVSDFRCSITASRIAAFVLTVVLVGCDRLYGIGRSAPISEELDPGCIERVLKTTPGIESFRHRHETGGYALTLTGFKGPEELDYYDYQGPGHVFGSLVYAKDYKPPLKLEQTSFGLRQPPPEAVIKATRPVMLLIEASLETQCGLVGLSAHVTEWCQMNTAALCKRTPEPGQLTK